MLFPKLVWPFFLILFLSRKKISNFEALEKVCLETGEVENVIIIFFARLDKMMAV